MTHNYVCHWLVKGQETTNAMYYCCMLTTIANASLFWTSQGVCVCVCVCGGGGGGGGENHKGV